MATLHLRCPRCRKARPLVTVPLQTPKGQGVGYLCVKCVGEVKSLQPKTKVVEKNK